MSGQDGSGTNRTEREPVLYTFGEYLRKLRLDRKMSLKEAAERMGMARQKLCDIESGRRNHTRLSMSIVQSASRAFCVPVTDIVSSVKTTLQIARSTEEVLFELTPLINLTKLQCEKLKETMSTYPVELENSTSEILENIKKIQLLTYLIQNRSIHTGVTIVG